MTPKTGAKANACDGDVEVAGANVIERETRLTARISFLGLND